MLGNPIPSLAGRERKAWKNDPGRGNHVRKGRASLGDPVQTGVGEAVSGWATLWQMNLRDNMRAVQKKSSRECFYFSDHMAGCFLDSPHKRVNREDHLWSRLVTSLVPYPLTLSFGQGSMVSCAEDPGI